MQENTGIHFPRSWGPYQEIQPLFRFVYIILLTTTTDILYILILSNANAGKISETIPGFVQRSYPTSHLSGACMKIVQLLQQHESLSSPFASLMLVCVRDYDIKTVVAQVIREIAQIEPGELARDTNATRNYCNFLLELGSTCGPVVLSAISSLLPHLDGDSYTMRNCVLSIIGDLIGGVLSEEGNEEKDTRETLFDR